MLDFLGSVPAEEIQHFWIGSSRLDALVDQDPVAKDRREVLDGGHRGNVAPSPPPPKGTGPIAVFGAQPAGEHRFESVGERLGVDTLTLEVPEHDGMRLGVPGLLLDEWLSRRLELFVVDERADPVDHVDEPALAGRQ